MFLGPFLFRKGHLLAEAAAAVVASYDNGEPPTEGYGFIDGG